MNDPDSEIRTILVAEDVVSRGDVLTNVEKLLRTTFGPSITVFKVVLFADKARIRANENSTLLENFHCFSEFDQASTWIVFPWETR